MGRHSPYQFDLTPEERAHLQSQAERYSSPHREVIRARIVLLAADGLTNEHIARRLGVARQLVSKWRKRFAEDGLSGLADRPRRPEGGPNSRQRIARRDGV